MRRHTPIACREAATDSAMLATELADYLVRKGVPFRAAHHSVGALVALAERQGRELGQLSVADIQTVDARFGEDIMACFSPRGGDGGAQADGFPRDRRGQPAVGQVESASCLALMQASKLLTDLLGRVSRSFYLTLRVLPRSIRTANRPGLSIGTNH